MTTRPRRPIVYLPPLDATSALSLINVLDAIIDAVWCAHHGAVLELTSDLTAESPRAPARRAPVDDDLF